jgi:putative flippase GtrA
MKLRSIEGVCANRDALSPWTASALLILSCPLLASAAPLANSKSVQTGVNAAVPILLTGVPATNGDTLTYTIATNPGHGTLSGTAPALTYTPTANYAGNDSFTFKVTDNGTASASAVVNIAVSSGTVGTPVILYTDIVSGPNSGGENNKGAYLSIFGKNFGATGLGTTTRVFIGGVEVSNYRYLGLSRARPDIQQITVQVGALGNPAPGTPLPISVRVNGVNSVSITPQTFTVNPGRFIFVDNVNGNDSTAVVNDIAHPYRHVQIPTLTQAAYGQARPGDFIVMRGKGKPWTDKGYENYFLRFRDRSGSAPTGAAGTGPITVMGYPGEDVFIDTSKAAGFSGAVSAINGYNYPGMGEWVTVSNLRVEGGDDDGPMNIEIYGNHWRIVNNETTMVTAQATARAGGVTGDGFDLFIYGNYLHDIDSPDPGLENHGIYIDNDGSYDIGYNYIQNVNDGNGIQLYTTSFTSGVQNINNVAAHHNWIQNVAKHGLNIADGSKAGIVFYDNVVVNARDAGLRFNTNTLTGCKIYNNTFYVSNLIGKSFYGMIMNDWNLPSGALDVENNIFIPTAIGTAPGASSAYNVASIGGSGKIENNLWFNGMGSVSADTAPVTGNPLFVSNGADFHLRPGSPAFGSGATGVSGVVTSDYDGSPRGPSFDIGAYAYALASAPSVPTNVKATAGNTTATVTWNAVSGAASYSVYRGTSPGAERATAWKTGITKPLFTNTGLTNGVTYYYKVTAVNSAGETPKSAEVSVTPAP